MTRSQGRRWCGCRGRCRWCEALSTIVARVLTALDALGKLRERKKKQGCWLVMLEYARGNRGFRRSLPSLSRVAWAFGLLVCAAGAPAPAAAGECKLAKIIEFPITMVDLRPELTAKINGRDVRF